MLQKRNNILVITIHEDQPKNNLQLGSAQSHTQRKYIEREVIVY